MARRALVDVRPAVAGGAKRSELPSSPHLHQHRRFRPIAFTIDRKLDTSLALTRPRARSCGHAQLRPHLVQAVTRLEHAQSHTIGAARPIYFASHRQTKFLRKTLRSPEPLHRHLDHDRRRLTRPDRHAIHVPLCVRISRTAEHNDDNRRHDDALQDQATRPLLRWECRHRAYFDKNRPTLFQ